MQGAKGDSDCVFLRYVESLYGVGIHGGAQLVAAG
jgi:hypothetical protein